MYDNDTDILKVKFILLLILLFRINIVLIPKTF